MAYNPFNVFRRNQKSIFAVLTVFIMFMFVLGSGLGGGMDFFEWLPQWIGSKSKKGDVVATVDGSKLYTGELDAIRRQRHMANKFMALASEVTQDQLGRFIRDQQSRMSPEGRQVIDRILGMERQLAMFGNNPQIMQMIVQQNMQQLQQLASSDKSRPEDKEVANAYILSMELAQRRAMAGGSEHYFVNLPNTTHRDSIEFMLWEKKADQLGIKFTTDHVKALIQKEFMRQFTSDVAVRNAMGRDGQGFSMDACLKAIAAEFRVRAAQTAVIGPVSDRTDRTTTAAPIYNPPYEMFQFYREQASPTTYQMLAVPAANFTELVTGTPTDDDLRRLYDQHKDQEPNPGVETPGFKEPRKLKVEWLSAKGDEPFYQKAAAEWLGKSQFAAFAGGGLTGNLLDAVATAPLGVNNNLLLESNYDSVTVARHRQALVYEWGLSTLLPKLIDTSVVRPENLAAAAGSAAGAVSSFGMNFGAATTFGTRAVSAEQRARIAVGMPAFLGGVPGPGMFGTVMAGEARSLLAIPKALGLDVVRPELLKNLNERTARAFMVRDLNNLNAELNKPDLIKNKDKSDAKKKIADFLALRGLPSGKSADDEAGFRDEWNIGDEAGLAAVKEAVEKDGSNPHGGLSEPVQFGKRFFWEENMRTRARQATRDTYKSEFYPNAPREDVSPFAKAEANYLVWRTEDRPAASVAFQSAKPKVLAAWKRIKARDLAKQRAEDIAAAIRKDTLASDMAIRQDLRKFQAELFKVTPDPKAADRVKFFELPGVCPLAPVMDVTSGSPPGSVRPFSLTPSTNIPYPTNDMAKSLLDERTNPVKTTVVLTDAPKDTYYVAVVSNRVEKDLASFKENVYSEASAAAARGMVNRAHAMDSVRKAKDSIMSLIKKEFKYVETEEQKQKLDENQKKGGES